jgi:hypothetical protein
MLDAELVETDVQALECAGGAPERQGERCIFSDPAPARGER